MAIETVSPTDGAAAQHSPTTLALKQAAHLFEEIATLAAQTDRHCFFSHNPFDDIEDEAAMVELDLLRGVIKRMGWMADFGSAKLTGVDVVRGGAEHWMLAPVYPHHQAADTPGA